MVGSFYVKVYGNRVFLQMHSKIVPKAEYDLYFNREINLFVFCKLSLSLLFLRSKELSFCIGKNRSFRDSPRLFLLSSNAIATDGLSKQRAGKIKKMQMTHQHGIQLCQ